MNKFPRRMDQIIKKHKIYDSTAQLSLFSASRFCFPMGLRQLTKQAWSQKFIPQWYIHSRPPVHSSPTRPLAT